MTDPLDQIPDEIRDSPPDRPDRVNGLPVESTAELALLDIAESLRTIAAALASIDTNGVDTYSPRPPERR